jgi:hypothetical protein
MATYTQWLTLFVAGTACFAAVMQWRVNRKRLSLDFYDRRYKVFEALMKFMASVVQEARVSNEARTALFRETTPAQFLFDKDLQEYIGLVHKKSNEYTLAASGVHPVDPPAGYDAAQVQFDLNIWFGEQLLQGGLEKAFKPYLSFQKVR